MLCSAQAFQRMSAKFVAWNGQHRYHGVSFDSPMEQATAVALLEREASRAIPPSDTTHMSQDSLRHSAVNSEQQPVDGQQRHARPVDGRTGSETAPLAASWHENRKQQEGGATQRRGSIHSATRHRPSGPMTGSVLGASGGMTGSVLGASGAMTGSALGASGTMTGSALGASGAMTGSAGEGLYSRPELSDGVCSNQWSDCLQHNTTACKSNDQRASAPCSSNKYKPDTTASQSAEQQPAPATPSAPAPTFVSGRS